MVQQAICYSLLIDQQIIIYLPGAGNIDKIFVSRSNLDQC